ncbi:MAG: GNAT family N-acetyltransferase [Balneolaceae bacterium]|nr:GNAT family N-acetyltransferase [Balneolaceae bacterium]
MKWIHATNLEEISAMELYQILKLRQDVFIIEQQCIYEDIDDIDPYSEHIYLKDGETIVAYSRIVPAGKKFDRPSIGRIVVKRSHRGKGYGLEVVQRCMKILSKRNVDKVLIEAQNYLKAFYESLGFKKISDPYPVDGILHIKMEHTFKT